MSSDLVVQQALNKAQQREKEERSRYEEKMGSADNNRKYSNSAEDNTKKIPQIYREETESDVVGCAGSASRCSSESFDESAGASTKDRGDRRGAGESYRPGDGNYWNDNGTSYNRGGSGFERRETRDHHSMYGGAALYKSNLPPRLQKLQQKEQQQQQQQQQQYHTGGYRSNSQPVTMFEPQFGSSQANKQYSRDSGESRIISTYSLICLIIYKNVMRTYSLQPGAKTFIH